MQEFCPTWSLLVMSCRIIMQDPHVGKQHVVTVCKLLYVCSTCGPYMLIISHILKSYMWNIFGSSCGSICGLWFQSYMQEMSVPVQVPVCGLRHVGYRMWLRHVGYRMQLSYVGLSYSTCRNKKSHMQDQKNHTKVREGTRMDHTKSPKSLHEDNEILHVGILVSTCKNLGLLMRDQEVYNRI